MKENPIRAVIGVNYRVNPLTGSRETFYVKRSKYMQNYPGVWSLPSVQYVAGELPDSGDLDAASRLFARMSDERFGGEPVVVERRLIWGSSPHNPMQRMVELVLYRIAFKKDPELNARFYDDSEWLDRSDFKLRTMLTPLPCGLCTRLWEEFEDSIRG
jgi:hypothetical protein